MIRLSFRLNKSPEYICDYLTDMQKFATVHPVISKIVEIDNGTYLVHEKPKFGVTTFASSYPIKVEKDNVGKIIIIRVTRFRVAKITSKFYLLKDGDQTVVEETIDFKYSFPVRLIIKAIVRRHHKKLFRNIDLEETNLPVGYQLSQLIA